MRRLQHLVAIALLAIWLPASLHCEWEWSGLAGDDAAIGPPAGMPAADDTDADGCAIAGDAWSHDMGGVPSAPPCWALPGVFSILGHESVLTESSAAAPPDLTRCWSFLRRAAPMVRAPVRVS